MKILLVSDYGTRDGGAEIATLLLRDGLRRRGHEVLFFASTARTTRAVSEADVHCHGTTHGYRLLLQTANISARRGLRRVLAEFQPDVVHVGLFLTQLSPLILPLLRDVPSVYHAHWLRSICPTGFKLLPNDSACVKPAGIACLRSGCLPLHDWLAIMGQMQLWRRWHGVFDRIVANSEATRAALEAEGLTNIVVIPCGVRPGPARSEFAPFPTAFFSGRLTRQKGVHVLLDAWRTVALEIPQARLLIAGDGPERAALEQAAGAGVTFLGSVPHADLNEIARGAWIQVVPSVGFEPFGLVAVEGMMRGSAVVAARSGGLADLVEHNVTGRLTEPGDRDGLADTLVAMLSDRKLCEQMGDRGRRIATERYGDALYVERFARLYESLIADSRYA